MNPFQQYFIDVLKYKYADFDGRARRSEYWYFALFNILLYVIPILAGAFFEEILGPELISSATREVNFVLFAIIFLGLLIPNLAISVRRLHDTGCSGWLYLINIIPYLGGFIFFIITLLDSQPHTNKWGGNPKAIVETEYLDGELN